MRRLLPRNRRLRYGVIALAALAVIGSLTSHHPKKGPPPRASSTSITNTVSTSGPKAATPRRPSKPQTVTQASPNSPLDIRIVAGSMPGTPETGRAERFTAHRLGASDRRYYNAQFRKVTLREDAADAIAFMGRIHTIVHYGIGPSGCDYFDGGYVICIWRGLVAAKGYETR